MKPEFVVRWATSKCGTWDIESPADGSRVRLNQRQRLSNSMAWVTVGYFDTVREAVSAAESRTPKGRVK